MEVRHAEDVASEERLRRCALHNGAQVCWVSLEPFLGNVRSGICSERLYHGEDTGRTFSWDLPE
jgi:hypothetical protein